MQVRHTSSLCCPSRRGKDRDELVGFVDELVKDLLVRKGPRTPKQTQPGVGFTEFLGRHTSLVHKVGGALSASCFLIIRAAASGATGELTG
jgi:hypothetical protein